VARVVSEEINRRPKGSVVAREGKNVLRIQARQALNVAKGKKRNHHG